MTDEEKNVLTWACNLTDSIVAGDYRLPKEMTYCINNLQDAVYSYLGKSGLKLKDMVSEDYAEVRNRERESRESYVRGLLDSRGLLDRSDIP